MYLLGLDAAFRLTADQKQDSFPSTVSVLLPSIEMPLLLKEALRGTGI